MSKSKLEKVARSLSRISHEEDCDVRYCVNCNKNGLRHCANQLAYSCLVCGAFFPAILFEYRKHGIKLVRGPD